MPNIIEDHLTDKAHLIDKALTVDKYEMIVCADLRMLLQYRDLLHDARHALANGRTAVVDEFLERTLDAMDARVDAIRAR